MSFRLDGKRALVTGAGSGIGRAIAVAFANAGAEVLALDLQQAAADDVVKELTSLGAKASPLVCDVSDEKSIATAFGVVEHLDLLVNSAGIAHVGTVRNTGVDDFDRLYRVNVRGTYLCMQAGLERMEAGGAILNMASIAATSGLDSRFAYSMTKGAVLAMTLSAAKDLLAAGIRCNCISPARVHTPFVDGFLAKNYPGKEAEMMKTLSAAQPIGRMGQPKEIADLALYLCSDAASFITGCDMPIDGGFLTLR